MNKPANSLRHFTELTKNKNVGYGLNQTLYKSRFKLLIRVIYDFDLKQSAERDIVILI